ncbi:MAG: putative phage tail protein [bacterium]
MAINSNYMLPNLVKSIPQMSDLLQAEQKEIDYFQELISSAHDELYINTCSDSISRYEQIFNIDYNDFLTLEERRLNVIAKLISRSNTTIQAIKDIVFIMLGCNSEIVEYYSDYSFLVNILLGSSNGTQSTSQAVNQINIIKPAHLLYILSFKIDPIIIQNQNDFSFYKFKVKARLNNWGFQKNIYLDGDNILSGSWVLGHECKSIKLHKFRIKISINNWSFKKILYLDDSNILNGSWFLGYNYEHIKLYKTLYLNNSNILNGSWFLGYEYEHIKLHKFKIKLIIQNQNANSINVEYKNQILLEYNLLLDGKWLLNSQ